MYACLKCDEPYFVCECLLDISLPIRIPKQQRYSGGGSKQNFREKQVIMRGDNEIFFINEERRHIFHACYSDQSKSWREFFLEALTEEQNNPEDEGWRNFTRPVTLTANALTMQPSMKRTLVCNPPAVRMFHRKRFKRMATGFMKRSDELS